MGGAVTEQPWGPDYKMTALSYVVSLMPPTILRELELERHGYRIHPQGPYFAPHPDGRALRLPDDRCRADARRSPVLAPGRGRVRRLGALARRPRRRAGAAPHRDPTAPRLASPARPPRSGPARVGRAPVGRARRRGHHAAVHDEHRGSARGPLRVRGHARRAVGQRRDRHLGRPPVRRDRVRDGAPQDRRRRRRQARRLGIPRGRHGRGHPRAALRPPSRSARTCGPMSTSNASSSATAGRTASCSSTGEEIHADVVIAATHPQITFLHQLDAADLPDDFVDDLAPVEDPQRHGEGQPRARPAARVPRRPGFDPEVHGGTIVLAPSLDHVEHAFQDAVAGRPRPTPFADICIPSVFDRTLAPEGTARDVDVHAVGARRVGDRTAPRRARALRRPGHRGCRGGRPRVHRLDPAPPGHRPVRDGAHLRADRRQHLPRRALARPAVPHAPGAGLRRLPHADRGASTRRRARPTAAAA